VCAAGHLAGLVTSNSRHAASGAPLPGLNYSVAAAALAPLWVALAAAPHADLAPALAAGAGLSVGSVGCMDALPPEHSTPADPASQDGPALRLDRGCAALAALRARLRALDLACPDLAAVWALAAPPQEARPGAEARRPRGRSWALTRPARPPGAARPAPRGWRGCWTRRGCGSAWPRTGRPRRPRAAACSANCELASAQAAAAGSERGRAQSLRRQPLRAA
jgi:hypothetical protein